MFWLWCNVPVSTGETFEREHRSIGGAVSCSRENILLQPIFPLLLFFNPSLFGDISLDYFLHMFSLKCGAFSFQDGICFHQNICNYRLNLSSLHFLSLLITSWGKIVPKIKSSQTTFSLGMQACLLMPFITRHKKSLQRIREWASVFPSSEWEAQFCMGAKQFSDWGEEKSIRNRICAKQTTTFDFISNEWE